MSQELGSGMTGLLSTSQIGVLETLIVDIIPNPPNAFATGEVVIYGATALANLGTLLFVKNDLSFIYQ